MKLSIKTESWPIKGHFTISRSSLTSVEVVTVNLSDDQASGRGECRPYARYNETAQTVYAQLESIRHSVDGGLSHDRLTSLLPAGAALNALDCALWDYQCKSSSRTVWEVLGIAQPKAQATAFTISIDSPDKMATAAKKASDFKIIKIKVDENRFAEQITAVATARPDSRLIVDANEALQIKDVYALATHPHRENIALIEQPLHDTIVRDHSFKDYDGPILCADESFHGLSDLPRLKDLGYGAINIKLDKCGGLSAALDIIQAAKSSDFYLMGGCMLSTSLAVAPMAAIMEMFDIIDLDAGALLAKDRDNGLTYKMGQVHPPSPDLWG